MATRPNELNRVTSTDGVSVAVHHLGGDVAGPKLLISHATGFHARCYVPIATSLADRVTTYGLDYRGHGATHVEPTWRADWTKFGDDALAVARSLAPGGHLVGFGHSMGGAALLMAAHRQPGLFDRLVLFEPISHQATTPDVTGDEAATDMAAHPIVQGARRRRRRFASVDEAFENYRAKPPLASMTPEALRNYVDHGFRPVADEGDASVELCCSPELEADIFMTGRDNGVWNLLPDITTPCVVVAGRVEPAQPSSHAEAIADRLPHGSFVCFDVQTHFGPFSHPDAVATLIASAIAT